MNTQHVNLFASGSPDLSLRDFAKSVYAELGISEFEERESSNYVDGHYFSAVLGPRVFKVMLSNSETHVELPYWVRVSSTDESKQISDAEIASISNGLIRIGYKVARIINPGQRDELRIDCI